MSRTFGWLLAAMFALAVTHGSSTTATAADESVLAELYGNGVNAYFSGDSRGAHEQLTWAVDAGTEDPRVYYFRALSYLKLGRDPEAKTDFEKGASLEIADVNNQYPVNRSLERIQGPTRMTLEGYRTKARMVEFQQSQRDKQQRYGTQRSPAAVLQRVESTPLQLHATPDMNATPKPPVPAPTAVTTQEPNGVPAVVHDAPPAVSPGAADAVPPAATATPTAKASDVIDPFSLDVKETPSAPKASAPIAPAPGPATPIAEQPPVAKGGAPMPPKPAADAVPPVTTPADSKASGDPFADDPASKSPGATAPATTPAPATPAPAATAPAPATPTTPAKTDDDPFK